MSVSTSNISNCSARVEHVSRGTRAGLNPVNGVHPVIVQAVGREVAQVKLTCVELEVQPGA